jgi:broad specificity phosphatase PhoE
MTRLLLVRHAEPAGSWQEHEDPGLSDRGRRQAAELATRLGAAAPRAVVSSPLARARETAAALAAGRPAGARVEPGAGEVPTPRGRRADRAAWLQATLRQRWPAVDADTQAWRDRVLETLAATAEDTIVVTHFVAINVAVGAATGDDRVWCCSPAYCSVTELAVRDGSLTLLSRGAEAEAQVG